MELTQKMKVTRATLQVLFIISAVLAIVSMVYSSFGLRVVSSRQDQLQSFANDWHVQTGVSSKRVSLPKSVELTSQGSLVLTNVLPSTITDSDVLCIVTNHQNLDVQVGDASIYSYKSRSVIGDFFGKSYRFIPLTSDMAGKQITLTFMTLDNVSKTYVEQPLIGSNDAVYRWVMKENGFALVTSAFFLLFGLGLLAGAIIMYIRRMRQRCTAVLMMGLFFVLSAVSELYQTGLLAFIFSNESFLYLLGYATQMLLLVPLLLYFMEVLNFRHRLLTLICELSMMCFIVQYILYLYGTVDFGNMEIVTLLLWLVAGIYLVYVLSTELVRYHRREALLQLIAMAVFALSALTDVIFRFLLPDISVRGFDIICTFICKAILLIDVVKLLVDEIQERLGQNLSSQMAFLDGLTHMANRSSYNRHLDQLSDHQDHELTVAVVDIRLDLAELMQVNEKQGYNAGDEMVLGCAECVNRTFRNLGKCYRISGNEFVVILERLSEETVKASIDTFSRTLQEFNEAHVNKLHVKLGHAMFGGIMTKAKVTGLMEEAAASAEEVS